MRGGAIRSARGYIQQEPVLPWGGYVLWVGSALLLLLLAVNSLMPHAASRDAAEIEFPPIRIRSDVKGPDAVVIDTSHAMLGAVSDGDIAASEPVALTSSVSDHPPETRSRKKRNVKEAVACSHPGLIGRIFSCKRRGRANHDCCRGAA